MLVTDTEQVMICHYKALRVLQLPSNVLRHVSLLRAGLSFLQHHEHGPRFREYTIGMAHATGSSA